MESRIESIQDRFSALHVVTYILFTSETSSRQIVIAQKPLAGQSVELEDISRKSKTLSLSKHLKVTGFVSEGFWKTFVFCAYPGAFLR